MKLRQLLCGSVWCDGGPRPPQLLVSLNVKDLLGQCFITHFTGHVSKPYSMRWLPLYWIYCISIRLVVIPWLDYNPLCLLMSVLQVFLVGGLFIDSETLGSVDVLESYLIWEHIKWLGMMNESRLVSLSLFCSRLRVWLSKEENDPLDLPLLLQVTPTTPAPLDFNLLPARTSHSGFLGDFPLIIRNRINELQLSGAVNFGLFLR